MNKFFVGTVGALAVIGIFAAPAVAQTLDLNANGGLFIGGLEMEGEGLATSSGSTTSLGGDILSRTSMSESGSLAEGGLTIDSNSNRTNVDANLNMYNGAMAANAISTSGLNAGGSSSLSQTSIQGTMSVIGGGLNAQASGSITLP